MKDNLQEATQRALVEGYKNLKENKSKKIEAKLEDIQMEIYEMIQTARKVNKQDKDTNKRETAYAIMQEYPEINKKELINYISKKADEIYAGDYDEEEIDEPVKESKKVEAYNYNWRDDIDEVENTEENDELVYAFAENLMENDPDYADYDDPWEIISNIISIWKINKRSRLYDYLIKWYGSEEEMKKHIRSFYETNDAIYFETGTGYSIFDADLLGGNADGRTADEFGRFVANGGKKEESKKVEAKEDTTSAPDYLEKAFEVEVEYWLKALVDEDSNDEIGKKAQEVLDDKNKMKEIVNELVDGSDDLWEDIHRRIEELAGLHYRESSRVNESKKVTEDVDEDKVNLYDTVWDQISCYDEEYAQEQGIDTLDDEDVYNIIAEIMSRPDVQDIIREEIEDYAGRKNN